MPRTNFIEIPGMPGQGRCRVCDLPYSKTLPKEVAGHKRFHAKYIRACDTFGAPIPERERDLYISEGKGLMEAGQTFEDRVRGGKKWLLGKYNEHSFRVLLCDLRHMSIGEFFAHMERRGFDGVVPADVANALARDYSDRLQP